MALFFGVLEKNLFVLGCDVNATTQMWISLIYMWMSEGG